MWWHLELGLGQALGSASLSFGQLATILIEVNCVAALVETLQTSTMFGTMNPLLEYHYLKRVGL